MDGLLRADAKTRSEVYARALDPVVGWMSRGEIRRLEDLPVEQDDAPPPPSVEQMIATANNGNQQPAEVGTNGN